jgi:diadenosine tetraphosphatase ApaH/serine/threonine PP2A family protein phosphatase
MAFPMRYAFFGDIHGNIQALEAVLDDIEAQGVDEYVCMGDIVGYGANPGECVDRVRTLGCLCLAGNHDLAAIGKWNTESFTLYAKQVITWTRDKLTAEHEAFLGTMSLVEHLPEFAVVHASLHTPEIFNYITSPFDADLSFDEMDKPLLFHGHTHSPVTFYDTEPMTYSMDEEIHTDPAIKMIVNVGSVGQPRDENPLAAYALYDDAERKINIRRVEYDIAEAAARIRAAGLPEGLATRLELGK